MESPLSCIRKEKGLTQERLAYLAGVSQGHISDIENGYRPIKGKLMQFLYALGVDTGKLTEDQNNFIEAINREALENIMSSSVKKNGIR